MNTRRTIRIGSTFAFAVLLYGGLLPGKSEAQFLDRLIQQGRQQVEALIESAVRCAFDDAKCMEKAKAQKKPVVLTDKEGNVLKDKDGQPITGTERLPAGMQVQADPPREGVLARQPTPETLEGGRFTATFTSGDEIYRYSGVAWVEVEKSGSTRRSTIWLCPGEGMIYLMFFQGVPREGEHAVGREGVPLVIRRMPAPVGQRPPSLVGAGEFRDGDQRL